MRSLVLALAHALALALVLVLDVAVVGDSRSTFLVTVPPPQALAETNALLARALALHFAGDASSSWGGAAAVRRACCALASEDVADVRVSDRAV